MALTLTQISLKIFEVLHYSIKTWQADKKKLYNQRFVNCKINYLSVCLSVTRFLRI